MNQTDYNLFNLAKTYFYTLPQRCLVGKVITYPLSFSISLISCVLNLVLALLVSLRYNSLNLSTKRYFGPLISNGHWVIYFTNYVTKMLCYVIGYSVTPATVQGFYFILLWACCILLVVSPTLFGTSLTFHCMRKMRLINGGTILSEMQNANTRTRRESYIQLLIWIVTVFIVVLVFALPTETLPIGTSEEIEAINAENNLRFKVINILVIILLTAINIYCLVIIIIISVKSDYKNGFSRSSRVFMIAVIPFFCVQELSYLMQVILPKGQVTCVWKFSLLDFFLIVDMVTNILLFLFVVSEYKRISEKMCQVFVKGGQFDMRAPN